MSSNLPVLIQPGQESSNLPLPIEPGQDNGGVSSYLASSHPLFAIEQGQEDGGFPGIWCLPTYLF